MKKNIFLLATIFFLLSDSMHAQHLASTPPMGWNSFDSYGVYLYEEAAFANLQKLADEYREFGYEYFIIDNGWFGEYKLQPGTKFSVERHASDVNINDYGLLQPSHTYFPGGFQKLIAACHSKGLKFGLHLMRGIPRKAVQLNTPIKGAPYHAADIADTVNICNWCNYNYGVDMSKPGAQEFYNSLIMQMADWGVDFIKVDDIVPFPREVEAIAKAIKQCGRDIVLSLSPGDHVRDQDLTLLRQGNTLRVTADVWDDQHGLDNCFKAWQRWQGYARPGFWIDMDMIPFGQLQLMSPKADQYRSAKAILLSGKGTARQSELTPAQMRSFITLRALSASPLMIGGDLPTMDSYSFQLLTNKEVIAANQTGIMGKLIYEKNGIEVWKVNKDSSKSCWIGIFNRTDKKQDVSIDLSDLKIKDAGSLRFRNVWNEGKTIQWKDVKSVAGNDVIFLAITQD